VHLNNPFIVFSFWDVEHLVGKHCEIPIQLVMLWDMMGLGIGVCANISANFLSKKMDGYSLCEMSFSVFEFGVSVVFCLYFDKSKHS
jgi:hypothetical protein